MLSAIMPILSMEPRIILKVGQTEVEVNPSLAESSEYLKTAIETYEPRYTKYSLQTLSSYVASTWKRGDFSAKKASQLTLQPLTVNLSSLIHGIQLNEKALPKLITLWQKAYNIQSSQPAAQKAQEEKEIITGLSTMPLEQWISILYMTTFLQIELLYSPLKKTLINQVVDNINNIREEALFDLILSIPLWNDPLFKKQLIAKCLLFNIAHSTSRTLTGGHRDSINSLAITPDGSRLITGSSDSTAKIWDIATGTLLHTLIGHTSGISSVVITPDGSRVITGSWNHSAKIWDIQTGALLHTLTGHTAEIISVAITPNGSRVITGSWDHSAKIWDVATGTLLHTLIGHTSEVNTVAIMPDDSRVITASRDNTAKIWDIATGALLHTLVSNSWIVATAITPDCSRVITTELLDRSAKVWDVATGSLLHILTGHTMPIISIAITLDGSRVITSSWDHTAKIWDIQTGAPLHTLVDQSGGRTPIAVTPDGSRIITGSSGYSAKIWGKDLSTLNVKQLLALAILIHLKQNNRLKNLPEWIIKEKNSLPDDIEAWFKEQKWYNPLSWFR
jgi:WD40 repeat protein